MNGVTHEYVVDGTKIISDCWSESTVRHYIAYIYDAKGVIGMAYRNSSMSAGVFEYYIFEKNLQGDIVAVYDEYGFAAVTYTYDAWGNVTETLYDTTSNGQYNSFRYRGYFYDEETGLYYLNSRYYDPATGRFLNPDIYVNANGDLTGFNMYAYCSNNPVMFVDPNGESVFLTLVGAAFLGAVGQLVSDVVTSIIDGEWKFSSPSTYVGAAVGGVVSKLIQVPYLSEAAGSAASTAVEMLIDNFTGNGEPVGFEEFVYETTTSAVVGGMLGGPFNYNPEYEGLDIITEVGKKLGPKVDDAVKIIYTENNEVIKDTIITLITSPILAIGNTMVEDLPGTHIWD